ncbi:helix-turn-helix domain-containing protein [Streptomyces sp. NPDC059441]|uniref:helix-turn-helix domain-containing protein n=1 Tax=unclassified Streptomyces TaxID=2593676 RepID=UPI002250A0B1|nr:helix-turn-helix transcriptional regulator [Streptomyces sp. NBC_01764]MCX4404831.1 helix-turn-helix domain-containing protein [Streptomyces sp. NBC_01764]
MVLGRRLRDLRKNAGMSFDDAAVVLDVTPLTIRRMELAKGKWKLPYIQTLLGAYGVPADEARTFLALAKEANQPGWWHRHRDAMPAWFSAYVSLEEEASLIRVYEPHYVPGLLQTEGYARTILRAGLHGADEEAERRVVVRMERQKLLSGPQPPELWVVMDETVLRRPMVPPDVMRTQIDRLIEVTDLPHIKLQIMPFGLCAHEGMYGPFHIFRFPHEEISDIAYLENLVGAVYLDEYDDVTNYQAALDRMCAQALPVQRTGEFLGDIRKEL